MNKYSVIAVFFLCCMNTFASDKVLSIGVLYLPENINPAQATTIREGRILKEIFEGLLTINQKGNAIAGLAANWQVNKKGTQYRFNLRDNLFWSDGHPLIAMDFVNTFRASIEFGSKSSNMLKVIKNFNAIKSGALPLSALGAYAPDEKTLVIELESPLAFFDKQLLQDHFKPLPMHAIDRKSIQEKWQPRANLPTSGPYQLSSIANASLTLTKNPFYHSADTVYFEKLVFCAYENEGKMINDLVKQKISISYTGSNSRQLEWLKNNYPDRIKYVATPVLTYLAFNNTDAVIANPDIRKALAMLINKATLAKALTNNASKYMEAHSIAPSKMYQHDALPAVQWANWNRQKISQYALQLLKKSGFSAENPLEISLHVDNREHRIKIGKLLQSMWHQIGVKTHLTIRSPAQHYKTLYQNGLQIALAGWSQDYQEPYNFLSVLHSDFCGEPPILSGEINALMKKSLSTLDREKRESIYLEIEKINQQRSIKLPLTFSLDATIVSPQLEGYEYTGSNLHPSRWLYWKTAQPD